MLQVPCKNKGENSRQKQREAKRHIPQRVCYDISRDLLHVILELTASFITIWKWNIWSRPPKKFAKGLPIMSDAA